MKGGCAYNASDHEYRKPRREAAVYEEVRQAVFTLHQQGIVPSQRKVNKLLSNPNFLTMPIARRAFHEARRELGMEGKSN